MKYWTLVTVRITTRVGLCMALLLWWYSQSTVLVVSTPIVPRGLGATAYPFGVIVYQLEKTTAARWSFFRRELVDPDEFCSEFYRSYPRKGLHLPGVYYSNDGASGGVRLIAISHWLLCLAFLIATIATSVKWKKQPAEATTESPDE